jgi:hypothetical protein
VGDVLRLLFWLWLAVSLSIYGYRLVRRFSGGGARSASPASAEPTTTLPATPAAAAAPSSTAEGALVRQVIEDELATRAAPRPATGAPPPPTEGRSGLFAGAAAPPPPPGPSADTTVARALEGIAMPAGLVPLVGDADHLDPRRVAFSTSGVAPAEVGAALGDELERLGFSLRSVGEAQVEAVRGTTTVHVLLHPQPDQAVNGAERAFPLARSGDVVVELWV